MTYDEIMLHAVEMTEFHADKFIYALDNPEFKCWFVGRIVHSLKLASQEALVSQVLDDLMNNGR